MTRLALQPLRRALAAAAGIAALAVGAAWAQDAEDDTVLDLSGSVTFVGGIVDGDGAADADVSLRAESTTILDSGLELGAGAALRGDGQRPYRTYGGGRYSSLLAGGTRGIGPASGDFFLEGAYLFARGGFGSVYAGRDDGIASRLAVTAPSIFRSVTVGDWRSDLTGLNDINVVNDFSGTATKLTYMPPSGLFGGVIGQLQLGVSYAPTLGECGDDGCAPVNGFALVGEDGAASLAEQSWRDVVEAALYYQNRFDVDGEALSLGLGARRQAARRGRGGLRTALAARRSPRP